MTMKCYYDVLEVSRDAEAVDIKTAYRRLALRWHPDKNLDDSDNAKEQFQLVQNAYEVLSDPQERAWYDNHRDQLLRGAGTSFNDESLDLIPFFLASCYKGYGDDSKGFYEVYREVFKKLAAEEVDYLDDPEDVSKIPVFGKSDTEYEKVQEFYTYWLSFSTSKSYVWLDKYDIREADNRKVLKLLEKENQKIRQKARKERNDEIRQLVAFIRKRDRRVIAQAKINEEKAKESKKRMEERRKDNVIKRQQEIEEAKIKLKDMGVYNMNNFQEKLDEIEKHLVEEFGISDEESDYSDDAVELNDIDKDFDSRPISAKDLQQIKNLFCIACNKSFGNVKSFENHEKSKKHKENVMNMKHDSDCDDEKDTGSVHSDDIESEDLVSDVSEDEIKTKKSKKKKRKNQQLNLIDVDSDSKVTEDVESDHSDSKVSKAKKKKNKKQVFSLADSDSNCEVDNLPDLELNVRSRKARRAKKLQNLSTGNKSNMENSLNDTNSELLENKTIINCDEESTSNNMNATKITEENESGDEKSSKAKTKRKTREKKVSQKKNSEVKVEVNIDNIDVSHCCAVCKNNFTSKNKLFDHLKKTGHQIYIPTDSSATVNSKTKKKKESRIK